MTIEIEKLILIQCALFSRKFMPIYT